VMPGNLDKARLERFVRYGVSTVSATYERRSEATQQASIRGGIVADR